MHSTTRCRIHARHHIEASSFSGAVWPDETKNLTATNGKGDVVESGNAAKLHGDMIEF
jgi:hypothetical protein